MVGVIGELHPALQQKYDLPLAPIVFEIDVTALEAVNVPQFQEIAKFQAVTRDLALLVNSDVSVQSVLDILMHEAHTNPICKYLQAVVLFDEYRGKGLQQNEKSLAFRCTLQDTQATLQDDVIDAVMSNLIAVAEKKCQAKLRA